MAIEFKLPELGENIESGDLVRVIVSPGAQVNEGDPVIELETDKAVIEVPFDDFGHRQRSQGQAGRQTQSGPSDLYPG